MTTIIVVVVVALVFFVAVCVVTFMVWKRESEMRTDSIRAIEQNLERLTYGISPDSQSDGPGSYSGDLRERVREESDMSYMESLIAESTSVNPRKKKSYDPFGWVRETDNNDIKARRSPSGVAAEAPGMKEMRNPAADAEETDKSENRYDFAGKDQEQETAQEPEAVQDREQQWGQAAGDIIEPEEAGDIYDPSVEPEGEIAFDLEKSPGDMTDNSGNGESGKTEQSADESKTENEDIEDIDINTEKRDEISLDFIDQIERDEISETEYSKQQMGYDVGRSGRKYTASELETLIKE